VTKVLAIILAAPVVLYLNWNHCHTVAPSDFYAIGKSALASRIAIDYLATQFSATDDYACLELFGGTLGSAGEWCRFMPKVQVGCHSHCHRLGIMIASKWGQVLRLGR
jgi:hypothetical protein